ncbi:hypothetical protein JXM83_04150 [Candidatus Woesearchaeota archaeon]|nr:hypothetical protein [Candidatus Woesearchaeota archaeon]
MALNDIINKISNVGKRTLLVGGLLAALASPVFADGSQWTDPKTGITYHYSAEGAMTGYEVQGERGPQYFEFGESATSTSTYGNADLGGRPFTERYLINARGALQDGAASEALTYLKEATTNFLLTGILDSDFEMGVRDSIYNERILEYLDTLEMYGQAFNMLGQYDDTLEMLAIINHPRVGDFDAFPDDVIDVYTQMARAYKQKALAETDPAKQLQLFSELVQECYLEPVERFGEDKFLDELDDSDGTYFALIGGAFAKINLEDPHLYNLTIKGREVLPDTYNEVYQRLYGNEK